MTGIWRQPTQAEKNDFTPISQFTEHDPMIHARNIIASKFQARNKSLILKCKTIQEVYNLKLGCPRCFCQKVDSNLIDPVDFEGNFTKFQHLFFHSLDQSDKRIFGTNERQREIILRYTCKDFAPCNTHAIERLFLSEDLFKDANNLELFNLLRNKAKANSGELIDVNTQPETAQQAKA